jgi:hypothetical protein
MGIAARCVFVLCLFVQARVLFAQTLFEDNFTQDSSLNQTLWSTGTTLLLGKPADQLFELRHDYVGARQGY